MSEEQVKIKTPEFVSLQFRLAGLGSRGIAMIIDQLILTLANILVLVMFVFADYANIGGILNSGWVFAAWLIGLFVLNWGYFFIGEYFFNGKTIGKRIVGIRVIQENGHGITLLSAFIRNLIRIVDMLPTSYVLGMILIFFNSKHKRLGDMAAGTLVVHERKRKNKGEMSLQKEINRRGISENSLQLNDLALSSLGSKEYDLLKTYSYKLLELDVNQRNQLTRDMTAILFPKIGLDLSGKSVEELENNLLILYLKVKKDWEFEL